MKILLISIDLVLGTRILVNVLKERGFEAHNLQIVEVKYSDNFSQDNLQNIYEFSRRFDVVGLSFNSFYSLLAVQLMRYLKSKGRRWIIVGGPHATALPEEVIKYSDIVVSHEAEITLPSLLDAIRINNPINNINGVVFKDGHGRLVNTGYPEIENNLDNIPFQNLSDKDITYYDFKKSVFEEPTIDNLFPHGGRNYFIMASRGCPFKCSYCCNSLFLKLNNDLKKIRKRTVQNIISEMEIAKQTGFKGFYIADDNFLAFKLEELEDFAKQYKDMVNLPFGISGLNPNNMKSANSKNKIELLLSCGLSDVRIGVQSGSNKTLKIFNRGYTANELHRLLCVFENRKTIWKKPHNRLRIAVDFIADGPWENERDKLETLKLANNLLSTYSMFIHTLIYLPGTDIYELALRRGWIKDKEKDIYLRGIAGVEDNIYNRLLFLIAVLKERGGKIPEEIITCILEIFKKDPHLAETFIDFIIDTIKNVEDHHFFNTGHLTLHPYLRGFNAWKKTVGQKGKKVLFRSYYEPYG